MSNWLKRGKASQSYSLAFIQSKNESKRSKLSHSDRISRQEGHRDPDTPTAWLSRLGESPAIAESQRRHVLFDFDNPLTIFDVLAKRVDVVAWKKTK